MDTDDPADFTEDDDSPDECDQCTSTDVEYPYTTMGYLCGRCRHNYKYSFEDVE